MARNKNTTTNSSRNAHRTPSGRVVPVLAVLAAKAVSLLAVVFAYYFIAFFVAVRIVPVTMGFVKDGTGVTMNMPVDTILAVWVAPSLFLIALIFAGTFVAMRKIWHLRTNLLARLTTWVSLREHPARVVEGSASASKAGKSGKPTHPNQHVAQTA